MYQNRNIRERAPVQRFPLQQYQPQPCPIPYDAYQPAPVQRHRGRDSRRGYNSKKNDAMRVKNGTKELANIEDDLKKTLFVCGSDIDATLNLIEETETLKTITLTVTTRGIGFSVAYCLRMLTKFPGRVENPTCYSVYRVALLQFEAKVMRTQEALPLPHSNSTLCRTDLIDSSLARRARINVVTLKPLADIINQIGILKFNDAIYVPAQSLDQYNSEGEFIPYAHNVTFSNLRKTVEALASPHTRLAVRRAFHLNSAIPGAIWNNDLLLNPDDIMPPVYGEDEVMADIELLAPWMVQVQTHVPKLLGRVDHSLHPGDVSLLISNSMGNVKVTDRHEGECLNVYYSRNHLEGNVINYHSLAKTPAASKIKGMLGLLGEVPAKLNVAYPLFIPRDHNCAAFNIAADYRATYAAVYGF